MAGKDAYEFLMALLYVLGHDTHESDILNELLSVLTVADINKACERMEWETEV